MRYYLDTNILVFLMKGQNDELSQDVRALLDGYDNILLTSIICVQELVHLYQIGKFNIVMGNKKSVGIDEIQNLLSTMNITPVSPDMRHIRAMTQLPLYADHRDPADRLIVAQAIADRVPVISSDHKFRLYQRHGLEFVYNRR